MRLVDELRSTGVLYAYAACRVRLVFRGMLLAVRFLCALRLLVGRWWLGTRHREVLHGVRPAFFRNWR